MLQYRISESTKGRMHIFQLQIQDMKEVFTKWGEGVLCPRECPREETAYSRHMKESEVAQPCPTLCDPMDCSLPGFSVYGIFQARVLEWGAFSFSRGSSLPKGQTQVSCIAGRRFTLCRHMTGVLTQGIGSFI